MKHFFEFFPLHLSAKKLHRNLTHKVYRLQKKIQSDSVQCSALKDSFR